MEGEDEETAAPEPLNATHCTEAAGDLAMTHNVDRILVDLD
jgi:hypothetical protein